MNAPLKRVAIATLVMFLALLVNANYVQVVEAGSLRKNPHNSRVLAREYARQRGPIVVDGKAVAESRATKDTLKYLRVYPQGALFAPVTGYYSLYSATGIERAENDILSGQDDRLFVRRLSDLITGREPQGGAVVLTLNGAAQAAAAAGLKGKRGAVVALNPRTGAILALVSDPSYDPNLITSHNARRNETNYQTLSNAPGDPLLNRAISQTYPPGSLFKIVTAATAFSSGKYNPSSVIASPDRLKLPLTTATIGNFAGERCGDGQHDTLSDAFRISCNTAFGGLGLALGGDALRKQAQAFGIDSGLSIPLPVVASHFPDQLNAPQTAQSAIGQFDVRLTPMQAAMIGAGVANGGVVMKPYLVQELRAPDTSVLDTTSPHELSRAVSPQVATQLKQIMELVVASGTGTAAQIPGIKVAGKTGTAQNQPGKPPHAWFVSFAPADDPQVVVAVVVENGGGRSDATGGAVAAPIARAVMCAVLKKC
jgi:peptidoglycan glycosyltransferase